MDRPCSRRLPLHAAALGLCLQFLNAAQPVRAAEPTVVATGNDLTALSLNELLNIEVTSVSKRAEPLADSAAAVFVLSGDEIRRSGAHSIAEALRLVPGLEVAQISAQQYAITARGFNSSSADKLQVLLDGRSVYTPLFSGVFWDVLDTYLGDIDRIEVIRGPGAALWGANAVNGVINIITRDANATQGTSVRGSGGTSERAYGGAREGFTLGSGAIRIYAQGLSRGSSALPGGGDAVDGMRLEQAGFRSDWSLPGKQNLTVSGDGYTGRERSAAIGGTGTTDTKVSGANLVALWSGSTSHGSDWSLQAYFDDSARHIPQVFAETRNTANLDFQQSFRIGDSHTLLYGAGYRASHDDTAAAPALVIFSPARRTLQTGSAFVQDQVKLSPTVELTIGSKFEIGTYVNFTIEPSLRVGWRASDQVFTWAAISRAVRTPNRLDEDVAVFCPLPNGFPGTCGPGAFRIGNPGLKPTKLTAYEWGMRYSPWSTLSLDLATFYNDYTDLRSTETTPPPFGSFANKLAAHSFGGELSLLWRPLPWATLRPYYQFLSIDASTRAGSTDVKTVPALEGSDPRHQMGMRIALDPDPRWQVNLDLRYVDKLPAIQVPDYAEMNLRLAYLIVPHLELALSGQNLLDSRHTEWGAPSSRFELRRAGMIELSWGLR